MEFKACAKVDLEFKDITEEEVDHFFYILLNAKDKELSKEQSAFCEKITKYIGQVVNKFSKK